jgi:hypothetical protein
MKLKKENPVMMQRDASFTLFEYGQKGLYSSPVTGTTRLGYLLVASWQKKRCLQPSALALWLGGPFGVVVSGRALTTFRLLSGPSYNTYSSSSSPVNFR